MPRFPSCRTGNGQPAIKIFRSCREPSKQLRNSCFSHNMATKKAYRIGGKTVKACLRELARNGNKNFVESLHPGLTNILGLRVPEVRSLARQIAQADWRSYLDNAPSDYMEERMLQGFVIGYARMSTERRRTKCG